MGFDHKNEHIDDNMAVIQANIDAMNPEICPYVSDKLFAAGANDVYWVPIMMKKGRPGLMLNVLVDAAKISAVERVVFTETTTLGLRVIPAKVHRLGRSFIDVPTAYGTIKVKVGYYEGKMVQYAPEYEECRAAAARHQVPLKMVYDEVKQAFQKLSPAITNVDADAPHVHDDGDGNAHVDD